MDLGVAPADNAANAPDLLKAAPTAPHHHPDLMALPQAAPMDRVVQVDPVDPVGLVAGVDPVSTKNACSLTPWNSTPTKTAASTPKN